MPRDRSRNRPAGGERKARGGKRRAFRGSRKKSRKGEGGRKAGRKASLMEDLELQYLQHGEIPATPGLQDEPQNDPDAVTSPELSRMIKENAESDPGDTPEDEPVVPADTHFLTAEELQSLSAVFGHFSEFSEVQYDDPSNLGVPSSSWVSVQTELQTICSSIEEIRSRSGGDVDALKPLLAEIKAEVEMGHRGREALASSLITLSEDLQEMRLKLSATSKSAVESAVSVSQLNNRLDRDPQHAETDDQHPHPRPTLLVGLVVLVLCWALILYLRTGDLRMAMFAVVGANFAGCAALLASRKLKWS